VTEEPGAQQVEDTKQELAEGEEQVPPEEDYYDKFDEV